MPAAAERASALLIVAAVLGGWRGELLFYLQFYLQNLVQAVQRAASVHSHRLSAGEGWCSNLGVAWKIRQPCEEFKLALTLATRNVRLYGGEVYYF